MVMLLLFMVRNRTFIIHLTDRVIIESDSIAFTPGNHLPGVCFIHGTATKIKFDRISDRFLVIWYLFITCLV
jgi:hypothetical protein